MYQFIPEDAIAATVEMVCYFFTIVAAVVSCMLTTRG